MDGYNIGPAEASRLGIGFPGRRRPAWKRLRPWLPFALCVLLPTLLGAVYFTLIAADQYYSDASFVIRSPGKGGSGGGGGGALGALLQTSGLSRSQDDTYSVNEYLTSRDALTELERHDRVREIYARPEADLLARFPIPFGSNSFESLYKYFLRHVDVTYDNSTGVTRLQVRTFRAEDSRRVAGALLAAGERLLNRLNERALQNAVGDAQREVSSMEARVAEVEARLAAFRSKQTVIDPAKQSQIMLLGVAQLEQQLAGTQTLVSQLQHTSPGSPLLVTAVRRADAIRAQIGAQQRRVTGEQDSMVPRIASYDSLQLQEEIGHKGLASAIAALETARMDAVRQQLYLDPVVAPNLADRSLYPRPFVAIAIVFATFLTLYLIGRLLVSGMREHQVH